VIHVEHSPEGLILRTRPEGIGRFGGALFLGVWLCFWLVGEVIVVGVLVSGGWVMLTGREFSGQPRTIEPVSVLGVGGFLLVWVSFWTLGGAMAIAELLRLVSSEETLMIGPADLTIRRRRGPFTSSRTIPRADVRGVRVSPRHRILVLDTKRRSFDLVHVPTPADEHQTILAVGKALGIGTTASGNATLPEGWEEAHAPEGDRVLVRDTRVRRKQALVVAATAVVFWAIALPFAWSAMSHPSDLTAAVILTILAALSGLCAYWLEVGRQEIKLDTERLVVRRRWRGEAREIFIADRLELELSTDSDGDTWYKLVARNTGAFDPHPRRFKDRRTLSSAMNDPFEPTALGRWLAARTGMPYTEP